MRVASGVEASSVSLRSTRADCRPVCAWEIRTRGSFVRRFRTQERKKSWKPPKPLQHARTHDTETMRLRWRRPNQVLCRGYVYERERVEGRELYRTGGYWLTGTTCVCVSTPRLARHPRAYVRTTAPSAVTIARPRRQKSGQKAQTERMPCRAFARRFAAVVETRQH